jgi:hypothetical protein
MCLKVVVAFTVMRTNVLSEMYSTIVGKFTRILRIFRTHNGPGKIDVIQMDEAVYECRLCTDLDDVPHPGLAHEDQEDEDSLQAVDGVEQDNLPTCQFF